MIIKVPVEGTVQDVIVFAQDTHEDITRKIKHLDHFSEPIAKMTIQSLQTLQEQLGQDKVQLNQSGNQLEYIGPDGSRYELNAQADGFTIKIDGILYKVKPDYTSERLDAILIKKNASKSNDQ